jgi:hypothetical protein
MTNEVAGIAGVVFLLLLLTPDMMITLTFIVALVTIFLVVQKLNIRPVFVKVRANNSRKNFQ